MFDVQSRRYRHRELFEQPADEAKYFPPDLRDELARKFLDQKQVQVVSCNVEENTKTAQLKTPEGRISRTIVHRDWRVTGNVANHGPVEVVVSNTGKIIFGRCPCSFFQEHLLNQGPCEHLLALFRASEEQRVDQPSSLPTLQSPTFQWSLMERNIVAGSIGFGSRYIMRSILPKTSHRDSTHSGFWINSR